VSAKEIMRARIDADLARQRLSTTLGELQARLKPGNLASNAWEGVKDKSGELADDAVEAVRARPVASGAALGAVLLFLARSPIKSAASRLFGGGSNESRQSD
jgi:hypothetical protein